VIDLLGLKRISLDEELTMLMEGSFKWHSGGHRFLTDMPHLSVTEPMIPFVFTRQALNHQDAKSLPTSQELLKQGIGHTVYFRPVPNSFFMLIFGCFPKVTR
jgi:hypothetical protein